MLRSHIFLLAVQIQRNFMVGCGSSLTYEKNTVFGVKAEGEERSKRISIVVVSCKMIIQLLINRFIESDKKCCLITFTINYLDATFKITLSLRLQFTMNSHVGIEKVLDSILN